MPRPRKWRKVCCLPESNLFGPISGQNADKDSITMTVEEYETIRLIDLEGLTQEECTEKMNVARTTIQKIYNDARKKLAQSLVNGNILKIEGGDYKLCDEGDYISRCGKCCRRRFRQNLSDDENKYDRSVSDHSLHKQKSLLQQDILETN